MNPKTALRLLALVACLAAVPAVWAQGKADAKRPFDDDDCQQLGDFIVANHGKGMKDADFAKAVHGRWEELCARHNADAHKDENKGKGRDEAADHKGGPPPWAGKGHDDKAEAKGKPEAQGNRGVIFARGNGAQGAGGGHGGGPPPWAGKGREIGKYVQGLLERGLRGQELADAIHAYLRSFDVGNGHGNPGGDGNRGAVQGNQGNQEKGGPPPNRGNPHGNEGGRGAAPPPRGGGRGH